MPNTTTANNNMITTTAIEPATDAMVQSHHHQQHPHPYFDMGNPYIPEHPNNDITKVPPQPPLSSSSSSSSIPQGREYFHPESNGIKRKFTRPDHILTSSQQYPPENHLMFLPPPIPLPPTITAETPPVGDTVSIPHHRTEMTLFPTSRIITDDVSGLSSMSSDEPMMDNVPSLSPTPGTVPNIPPTPTPPPMSSIVAPRAQLHLLYGRPPRRKVISNNHYHCWPDSNPTHIQQWTAILVCPMTGELFLAGRCSLFDATAITLTNGTTNTTTTTTTTYWFTKKTYAEHGAAARAYDCWTFRDRMTLSSSSSSMDGTTIPPPPPIGLETPYMEPIYHIPELMVIPYEIRNDIIRQQAEIRRVNGLPPIP
jgi:hypothetical protein